MGLRTGALESRKAAFRLDSRSHAQPRPPAPGDTDQHCWALSGPHSPGGTGFWPEGGLGTGVPGGFGQTVPRPSGRRRFPSPTGRAASPLGDRPGQAPPGPRAQRGVLAIVLGGSWAVTLRGAQRSPGEGPSSDPGEACRRLDVISCSSPEQKGGGETNRDAVRSDHFQEAQQQAPKPTPRGGAASGQPRPRGALSRRRFVGGAIATLRCGFAARARAQSGRGRAPFCSHACLLSPPLQNHTMSQHAQ